MFFMDLIPGCDSFAMAPGTEEKAEMESLTSHGAFVKGDISN
jgi:hypothetical protein